MKVSVLLAHYHESAQPFLTACLRSLERQTFRDFETILVSSNHESAKSHVPDKAFHSATRLHFPAAIEKAYSMSDPSSEMILLLNDDAIMSKTCLENLVYTMDSTPGEMILGARSNCGPIMGWYQTVSGFIFDGHARTLGSQFRYPDIEPYIVNIIENAIEYPFGLIQLPFSPFFCTLIRRSTYEKVGRINPNFKTGSDDKEFADRARKHGIGCYMALHAAVAHASGVTADLSLTDEDRRFNFQLMEQISKSI